MQQDKYSFISKQFFIIPVSITLVVSVLVSVLAIGVNTYVSKLNQRSKSADLLSKIEIRLESELNILRNDANLLATLISASPSLEIKDKADCIYCNYFEESLLKSKYVRGITYVPKDINLRDVLPDTLKMMLKTKRSGVYAKNLNEMRLDKHIELVADILIMNQQEFTFPVIHDNETFFLLGTPVIQNGELSGVLIFEVSLDFFESNINSILLNENEISFVVFDAGMNEIFTSSNFQQAESGLWHSFLKQNDEIQNSLQMGISVPVDTEKGHIIYGQFRQKFTDNKKWNYALVRHTFKVGNVFLVYGFVGLSILFYVALVVWAIVRAYQYNLNKVNNYSQALQQIERGEFNPQLLEDAIMEDKFFGKLYTSIYQFHKLVLHTLENIGLGNYDEKPAPRHNHDVFVNTLNEVADKLSARRKVNDSRRQEMELTNWARQGMAEFSQILRENAGDIDKLSSEIIKKFVHYFKAEQGGLFVLEESEAGEQVLKLIAAHAFNKEKYMKKKFRMGEGLVGNVALEKQLVYINKIPEDYIEIRSGFGGSLPKSLIVSPLKYEDKVFGVIEIASFKEFFPHEMELIETISESVAMTLLTAQINTRTNILLEQSRDQARTLESREAELKKNILELQEVQEENQRRESEIVGIINAVNAISPVFEIDLQGNIIRVNDSFVDRFKLPSIEFMKGKRHEDFSPKAADPEAYEDFWFDLKRGIVRKEIENVIYNGQNVWLSIIYSPILDADQNVIKIMGIGTDISENKLLQTRIDELLLERQTLQADLQNTINDLTVQYKKLQAQQFRNLEVLNAIDSSTIRLEYATDGTLLFANTKYLNSLGLTLADVIGTNIRDGLNIKDLTTFEQSWSKVLSGIAREDILKMKAQNGKELWWATYQTPVLDKDGEVNRVLVLATDVTSQKNMEIKAKEQQMEISISEKKLQQRITEIETRNTILHETNKKMENRVAELLEEIKRLKGDA